MSVSNACWGQHSTDTTSDFRVVSVYCQKRYLLIWSHNGNRQQKVVTLEQNFSRQRHVLLVCKIVSPNCDNRLVAIVSLCPHCSASARGAEVHNNIMIHKATKWNLAMDVTMFINHSRKPHSLLLLKKIWASKLPSWMEEARSSASHCAHHFNNFQFRLQYKL